MVADYKSLAERFVNLEAECPMLKEKVVLPAPSIFDSSSEVPVLKDENDMLKKENRILQEQVKERDLRIQE
ncbi:hypothetical protein, partial [Serratia marcescens]|uniref:hypothetical protein n=1 Tax=Serratia marcescens TaxID=615 RepID=UPI002812E269